MREKIEKNFNRILIIFIMIQPFIDLITSISKNVFDINITIGIIVRTLFLLVSMYVVVYIYKGKKILWFYLAVATYSLIFIIGVFLNKNGVNLFGEIQGLVKAYYFPVLLGTLYSIKDKIKIPTITFVITLSIYIVLIIIPTILGIGFESYEVAKEGNLGWFYSANEISAIISILTPMMFTLLVEKKKYIGMISLVLGYIIAILSIGTKTPLLCFLITLICIIILLFTNYIKKRKYKALTITICIIVVMGITIALILPKTAFYKNIKIHMDYLEVESIKEVLEKPELIDHFIFSERLSFLGDTSLVYNNSNNYEKLFGIGYFKDQKQIKMIEMDYFDVYYSHGIIGFILYFLVYICILVDVVASTKKMDFINFLKYISVSLILILSLFTGHIITAPAVSLIAISIILSVNKKHTNNSILKV